MNPETEISSDDQVRLPFLMVQDELRQVEATLREQVRAFDPGVEPYVSYICDTAGKRIRPPSPPSSVAATRSGCRGGGCLVDAAQLGV